MVILVTLIAFIIVLIIAYVNFNGFIKKKLSYMYQFLNNPGDP